MAKDRQQKVNKFFAKGLRRSLFELTLRKKVSRGKCDQKATFKEFLKNPRQIIKQSNAYWWTFAKTNDPLGRPRIIKVRFDETGEFVVSEILYGMSNVTIEKSFERFSKKEIVKKLDFLQDSNGFIGTGAF